jgi:hypothetical protein
LAERAGRCLSKVGIAALAALLSACGDEPIPLQVTWEPTIRQVFAAHCVRCHGAGGTLNIDPEVYGGTDSPTLAYLDHLQDQGDCTLDPVTMSVPDSCKRGALFVKDTIKLYVETTGSMRMPPAPSAPLTDYERDLILKWVDNPL